MQLYFSLAPDPHNSHNFHPTGLHREHKIMDVITQINKTEVLVFILQGEHLLPHILYLDSLSLKSIIRAVFPKSIVSLS